MDKRQLRILIMMRVGMLQCQEWKEAGLGSLRKN